MYDVKNKEIIKRNFIQANRRKKQYAFLLVLPLLLFVSCFFVWPIADMLMRSFHNDTIMRILPKTSAALEEWDYVNTPGEEAFKAIILDINEAKHNKTIGKVATAINFNLPGTRSMITRSARKVSRLDLSTVKHYKKTLIDIDKRWEQKDIWTVIALTAPNISFSYYLTALDLRYNENAEIVPQVAERRIYLQLFWRTLFISATVTFLCILLAYPVSYYLSILPLRISNILLICVLLPFWTSLLVRTTSWIALLQSQGVLNDILVALHIIDDQGRLQLMFNQTGTIIAMTHILLPFMIMPLFSVMKTISPSYMRAATSLGATPFYAFIKIYFPMTLPGIGAGSILVFILSAGYYITPALVGGSKGQLISNMIAYHMQKSLNWSLAAALGVLLLVIVLVLYWLYDKIVGIDKMKLG